MPDETASRSDRGRYEVAAWIRGQPKASARFGAVLRDTLDEVLDGPRTGRFDVDRLDQVEKVYLGTKFTILTRAEFTLPPGRRAGCQVAGHEVELLLSLDTTWSVPSGAIGRLCLLVSADDRRATFDVGLVRATPDVLTRPRRSRRELRPGRATANAEWLFRDALLPENALLAMPRADSDAIMGPRSGQQRVNELLRRVQGKLIERKTTLTVAMQHDGMKRCRDARLLLAQEGIVVLGHQNEAPRVAEALGLPVPRKGSLLAVRLIRVPEHAPGRPTVRVGDAHYAVARPGDPVEPAPHIHC
ncbi:NaeI family type II restriction endonuclease [Actinosynnema sp. NPDC047251]|uniref:Putatibe restriction endonuclease n=2 Tax=Saccharothrix espanaensis TaxID=103731 RepID=K0K3I6_SACES|nr:Putatibe restriction endonuclease [Saccharothrix espanaensis DSM 44229]